MYTALDVATVDLELERTARRAGMTVAMVGPRRLATIRVRLSRVLDLTNADVRAALDVTEADRLLAGKRTGKPARSHLATGIDGHPRRGGSGAAVDIGAMTGA